jgi:catechol 2,3-dioxygenase-like lactoylglutathione lyase family enzyme
MDIHIFIVSLRAKDVPSAVRFYRDVIGLNYMSHHGSNRPHFDLGGSYLAVVYGNPSLSLDPAPRFPVIAFSVPDLDAAIENLRLHDVTLPWGVETDTATRWIMFRDPAGNLVELVEFKK